MSKNMARHLKTVHPDVYQEHRHLETVYIPKEEPVISMNYAKGCWARKYCQKVGEGRYRCNICSAVLRLARGLFGNMIRHIKNKHPFVYEKEAGSRSEAESEKTEKNAEDDSSEDDLPLDFHKSNSRKKFTSDKKGCWARKYCQKVGEGRYQCKICDAVLSLSRGLFGNMIRHIKSKHPYIYDKEKEKISGYSETEEDDEKVDDKEMSTKTEENSDEEEIQQSDFDFSVDIEFLDPEDPEFENKIKYLVTKHVSGKARAKNRFWNFFNVIEENHLYSCLACKRTVAVSPHSVTNLKRHIRLKHKRQYEIMMKYMASGETGEGRISPITFEQFYFDMVADGEHKCKECGDVIKSIDSKVLFDHIKDSHPDQILAYQAEYLDHEEEFRVVVVDKK